ncbi:EAL domain-containing protein [Psychrobacillus sp.]|uniref:sensor domain-containing protein n=1 Tax=Psychrobacillus sp. TaxID=1871623 RepID=UPI0028BD7A34|nr:EAL domain-containing protein [Psychrobacillus sp.]
MNNSANTNHAVSEYLLDILHQNPLQFTFLLKEDDAGEFSIIYTNDIGAKMFTDKLQNAKTFFSEEVWKQFHILFTYDTGEKQKKFLKHSITIQNKLYIFDISIVQLKEAATQVYGILMMNRTKEEDEKTALIEMKDKYLSIVNNNLDIVFSIDENGFIQSSNSIAFKILGYTGKNLLEKPVIELIESASVSNFQLMLKRTLSGYASEMHGCLMQHQKGYNLPVYLKTVPILVGDSVKGFHLIVRNTLGLTNDQNQLNYLAYHDHLTGLWNRRALKEHLRENLMNATSRNEYLTIMRIDLDRFKLINESLGYNYGDEFLKKIADRLGLNVDETSSLYRQSGDEFVYILKGKTREQSSDFAKSILEELSKPIYLNHQEYFVTASIGMSIFPCDGSQMDELLIKADQALYVAKDRGRAHYRYYQEQMNLSFPNEALMESHLRRAIEKEELSIHYQPQVNLATGEINSFEALLRWNNKKFGYVTPMHFIPLAEKSGIIMHLGDWVLEEVCKQLKYWQEKGYRAVRVAVNISPNQFKQENFAIKIRDKINKYKISPCSLEVEITESAMTDMTDTLVMLKELKEIGVVISIDDFGTGYSSLSYLKQYPIDIIKIDQSFIKDMETDKKNAAIATTIIQLAHSLGMEVVAEGVEKDVQVDILKLAKCQKAQGYLFGRPVPIQDINESYMVSGRS